LERRPAGKSKGILDLRANLLELDLPCDERAPATVRQALSDVPDAPWAIGDAMLVASELVTNAVLHSGCQDAHEIKVSVGIREQSLVIAVVDPGLSGGDAQVRENPNFGGFGLQIVDQLADKWGSERTHGYRVWAEVALRN
jgi:anti-sigma regulatory factor (Ser/Thr protein kinase)